MDFANIFGFGNPVELCIIAGVVVLLFGGSKLAGFGKSAGEALKEFKKATHEPIEDPHVEPSAPQMMETPVVTSVDSSPHTAEATRITSTKEL